MLACPSCKTNIITSKALAEFPPKIKCPGCGHIDAKESFSPVMACQQDELDAMTKITAPPRDPMTVSASNYYAPKQQPPAPVRVSTIEKVLNIEYQSTKSYAGYLWIMAILVGFGVDALAGIFILITSGKSIIASGAFINLERIAKNG